MHLTHTAIPEVLLIEPRVFGDARGFLMETWNARTFAEAGLGLALHAAFGLRLPPWHAGVERAVTEMTASD